MHKKKDNILDFDASTPEEAIAAMVDRADQLKIQSDALGSLLFESHPLYLGRGSNEVIRIQGYILASLEKHGLHLKTLPIALEALESSMSAYLVAAAAKAIRGLRRKSPQLVPYLLAGIDNIYYRDDTVTFNHYAPKWPLEHPTTALREIMLTIQWLGNNARKAIPRLEFLSVNSEINKDNRQLILETIEQIQKDKSQLESCCDLLLETPIKVARSSHRKMKTLQIQDQEGNLLKFGEFFRDKPTVLVFFYTRCENHNKCSLTINKLGKLQKLLDCSGLKERVKTAAMSYDPVFDTPERLKLYALKRHVHFDDTNRIFRMVEKNSMPMMLQYFNSAVNYVGNLINKHQIELYVLDEFGKPIKSLVRLQWEPEDIINVLSEHLLRKPRSHSTWGHTLRKIGSTLRNTIVPILIAFFPKCPLCWAAYMSIFGITGISAIPYSPWILPLLCIFLVINLWFIWRRARIRKNWLAFGLAVVGTMLLIIFGSVLMLEPFMIMGLILLITAALFNSLSLNVLNILKSWLVPRFSKT